jgi:hypothetical protein
MLFRKELERERKRVVLFVKSVEGFAGEAEAGGCDWVFVVGKLVEDLDVYFWWKSCEGELVVWKCQ